MSPTDCNGKLRSHVLAVHLACMCRISASTTNGQENGQTYPIKTLPRHVFNFAERQNSAKAKKKVNS